MPSYTAPYKTTAPSSSGNTSKTTKASKSTKPSPKTKSGKAYSNKSEGYHQQDPNEPEQPLAPKGIPNILGYDWWCCVCPADWHYETLNPYTEEQCTDRVCTHKRCRHCRKIPVYGGRAADRVRQGENPWPDPR